MKPVSIRFQCFGPYMEEQFIDFTRFEQSGLFLICGETGAGKTAILDAMCYALYGKSSGGLRGELEAMRCKLAGVDDVTRVEFIFDSGGKRYKFTRRLRYARKNIIDEHSCMTLSGGVFMPIFANPKKTSVNAKAEEIVGLTYEQFRQVVILPQGQFERLLVSDSAQKEEILSELFHLDRWRRIAEEIYRRVSLRDAELKDELARISMILGAHGCETPEALLASISQTREKGQRLTEALSAWEKEESAARKAYESALVTYEDFCELDRRGERLSALEKKLSVMEREERLLKEVDIAGSMTPKYTACIAARKARDDARAALSRDAGAAVAADKSLKACNERLLAHDAAKPESELRARRIALLESARPRYAELSDRREAYEKAEARAASLKKALDDAAADEAEKKAAWLAAMERQRDAIAAYTEKQAEYLGDIGGILALRLKPGSPCPVCGSTRHPSPAVPRGAHVTESELDALSAAMDRANKAVAEKDALRREAEKNTMDALSAHAPAVRDAMDALSALNALLSQNIEGIDTPEQLEKSIAKLKKAAADYDAAGAETAEALTRAVSEKSVADNNLERSRAAMDAAEKEARAQDGLWERALTESPFGTEARYIEACMEPEDRDGRRAAVITYRAELSGARESLSKQREKLEGLNMPDMPGLKQRRADAESAVKDAAAQKTINEQALSRMQRDHAEAARRKSAHDARRITADADMEFAKRLRGSSGVSLQRYVLGVMLSNITMAANELLKTVHGGRYRLYRTDEVSGRAHRSGLELSVLDSQSEKRRSVTTLSGGEKFLAALSLAIGLSEVVQAQGGGARLMAMFIDEGFGSLDQSSIGDALDVLSGLKRANGLVGIISHVERLKETIPAQIEIVKGTGGSRCVVR